ncbi:class I SAM-dependent methyltransferase [Nonomuraea rubra]
MSGDPYLRLGVGYAGQRVPDPRVAAMIDAALGAAGSVVNVGAGTGSYEPAGRDVLAVEPSAVMIAQRRAGSAPVVRARAERLPLADGSFDAALAVLTVHHWSDAAAGLAELRRVSARQVVLTWDPAVTGRFWLVRDYVPELSRLEAGLATVATVVAELGRGGGRTTVTPVPVPADCTDGFMGAYWRRPERYLDPRVRASISAFATVGEDVAGEAMQRLGADLESGRWLERHGDLLGLAALDLGYRLVVCDGR